MAQVVELQTSDRNDLGSNLSRSQAFFLLKSSKTFRQIKKSAFVCSFQKIVTKRQNPLKSNFLKNIPELIVDYLFLFFLLLFSTKIRKIIIFHLKGQSIATEQTPCSQEVVGLTPARLFFFYPFLAP